MLSVVSLYYSKGSQVAQSIEYTCPWDASYIIKQADLASIFSRGTDYGYLACH